MKINNNVEQLQGNTALSMRHAYFRAGKYSKIASCIAHHLIIGGLAFSVPALADDYFNPEALELKDDAKTANVLKQFSQKGGQIPGEYQVDIYLNGKQVTAKKVNFVDGDGKLKAEISPSLLSQVGVKINAFPNIKELSDDQPIVQLGDYIPDADTDFDFSRQRLDLSIPQAALEIKARNSVDPQTWDQGLNALQLNYNFSGSQTQNLKNERDTNSNFLNLRSGLNLGAWRLRNYSTYSASTGEKSRWENINTYIQRDVHSLKSQLTMGESSTPSMVFDSVAFRGVQLASDDNMLADSLRGFAPIIRGIARSNAQVSIRQNGYVIYQTYVAPGAFVINDLYPTASSGDLEVVIRESDGSERVSLQPFSAVFNMQREGQLKYSATAGQYRSSYISDDLPNFIQTSLNYGLPWSTTVYGGIQAAENYQSLALGLARGFGDWGALSADVTQANTKLRNDDKYNGQSYRLQYAKDIAETGTTFSLAGYRYSTSGFYDMREANELFATVSNSPIFRFNKRSQERLNINQALKGFGSFYITASQQDYWKHSGKERYLSAGYNMTHGGVNYGLDFSQSQAPGKNEKDSQLSFNIQIPLNQFMAGSWARYGVVSSKSGGLSHNAGLSGTALIDHNLHYQVQQTYDRKNQGYGGDVNATYKGSYGEVNGGYSYDKNSRQVSYGLNGSIVAHPYGVTLAQPLGETAVLVRAPGASDIKVQNNIGVKTDWRGYTVVPYVNNYRQNRISLDPSSYDDETDIDTATANVTPTNGALVLADFKTRKGSRVLLTLMRNSGFVPFGSSARLLNEIDNEGIVGSDGQLYLSGVPQSGSVSVKWGDKLTEQCIAKFNLPEEKTKISIKLISARCE